MEKHELIEKEAGNQLDVLPVFYKKLQYNITGEKEAYFNSSSLYTKSKRHQTDSLVVARFYKHITLFTI
jgi:hypothetical protein